MPEPPSRPPTLEEPPDNVTLSREGDDVVVVVRWPWSRRMFALLIAVVADGVLLFVCRMLLIQPDLPIWARLLVVPLGAVGFYITYDTVAERMNYTRIRVGSGVIDIWVGPIPSRGSK